MSDTPINLDAALELTRTGDIWLFRGHSAADRAIRGFTNSPVNHVGMAIAIDDLPALMWHAELGRSLVDQWTGAHQRGVQLHDLGDAVRTWVVKYGQRAWLRQLQPSITVDMEEEVLRCIARLDGTPFPSIARLVRRWVLGRFPRRRSTDFDQRLETAYCAEVVACTYQTMGLLPTRHRTSWYDAGRFWSGDHLKLLQGYELSGEIAVEVPMAPGQYASISSRPRPLAGLVAPLRRLRRRDH